MPSFRALQPSMLRPADPPRAQHRRQIHPRARRAGDGRLRRLRRRHSTARQVHPRRCPDQGARTRSGGSQAFVWIGLHEPDEHQMQAVADVFGLHELAVEDAVHAHQRPKLERYDDTLFLVLKTVNYVEHESVAMAREIVETGEIMIFVGPDFVVTVRHGDHGGLGRGAQRMDAAPANCALGPYAVHARDRRPRRRRLPRRHRCWSRPTSTPWRRTSSPRPATPTSSTSTCSSARSSSCAGRSPR